MTTGEPDPKSFDSSITKFIAATRPAFLMATLVPVILGFAYTIWQGYELDTFKAFLTLLAALLLHAGINVLNDYYDALNGTDDINNEHIFPFTGGSRFIQNGLFTRQQMRFYGIALTLAAIFIGIYLISQTSIMLFWLGMFGVIIGWGYSAPPMRLNSRGLGELTVLIGFTLLPLGSYLVQTGQFSFDLFLFALPAGLLSANLLYINQFPDRKADIEAGKLHWVARLGPKTARWGYLIIAISAYSLLAVLLLTNKIPKISSISLLPLLLSFNAARILLRSADQPKLLEPAIKMTIAAMLAHGVLLALSFCL